MTTENETVKEKTNDKDNMSHILNLKSMFNLHKRKKKSPSHPFGRNKLNVLSTSEDVNYEE